MKKYIIYLLLFSVSVPVFASENINFFVRAKLLSERNIAIKNMLHSYLGRADKEVKLKDESKFKYLLTSGEAAAICALLSGNIVGGMVHMNNRERKQYMEVSKHSIEECNSYITFKRRDLNLIVKEKKGDIFEELAGDLLNQFDDLEKELDFKHLIN